ncbi:MAG: activator of (R)-2-hydroxyglutaryl-CoA dehydratase [Acidobacteriota bacterium]|nr:MAG: activator of (R)-2-hydroxyglutaryl-CoA dehydratase [Acidobacteriota bacterium]
MRTEPVRHFKRPEERPFRRAERDRTTILFGGLTLKHEALIKGHLTGLGYRVENLPIPDAKAFHLGKELGNKGLCNPAYFTVGNLVRYLQNLRAQGMSPEEINDKYVFMTAGACGPCRFGMYEAEFRLALRNSGFEGFRVLLFQQQAGLNQSEMDAGVEFNYDFFLGFLNALNMGDLLNEVGYHIRPYEVTPGQTDEVFARVMDYLTETMRNPPSRPLTRRVNDWVARKGNVPGLLVMVAKLACQLWDEQYVGPFREAAKKLDAVQVDYTRPKPLVKITGEFWAQTTEGDGNFNMFRFLEEEGAEVLVEPVATWVSYLLFLARQFIEDRSGIREGKNPTPWYRVDEKLVYWTAEQAKSAKLALAQYLLTSEYDRLRRALGGTAHPLGNQDILRDLALGYYNSRSQGGEGHLEVAKNIYYHQNDLCHMVLSLKPFGCMPSTQSDGVQSAVTSHYGKMIYLPIETSGEGVANAHSRVQMVLGEAKSICKEEFARAVEGVGFTLEQIRDYIADHPGLSHPLVRVPHTKGIVGRAANYVNYVGNLMRREYAS